MYYTSQRAYTNIVWQKLEEEDYDTLLKENPFKHSIVGDVAAAANAHRNRDLYRTSYNKSLIPVIKITRKMAVSVLRIRHILYAY